MRFRPHPILATLLFAALAFAAAAAAAPKATDATSAPAQYVCPMSEHPEAFDHPGRCPICGMELVEKKAGENRTRVAILVFDGVQLIDFTAPYEVFGAAPFELFTVGSGTPAKVGGGLAITPTYTFAASPQADLVIVPGGRIPRGDAEVTAWIRSQAAGAKIVMSICNGAFLLAKAGLLDGLSATTTYGHLAELARDYPKTRVVRDRRFVDNGKVITTAGLSAGMDGSLHVVERLLGAAEARRIALDLEYHWQPDSTWTRPSLADRFVPNIDLDGLPAFTQTRSEGDANGWRIEVSTPAAATPELLGTIAAKVEAATGWKAKPGTGAATERRYFFADEERHGWSARLALQPATTGSGSLFLFTLTRSE